MFDGVKRREKIRRNIIYMYGDVHDGNDEFRVRRRMP